MTSEGLPRLPGSMTTRSPSPPPRPTHPSPQFPNNLRRTCGGEENVQYDMKMGRRPREHHRGTGGGPVLRPRGVGGRAVELFPSRGADHLACSVNHREVQ